jgi:hypothetical protein
MSGVDCYLEVVKFVIMHILGTEFYVVWQFVFVNLMFIGLV